MTPQRHIPSSVPPDLADLDQWVLWLYDKERRKIPYQPNGSKASSSDPATWTDLATALELANSHERLAGIGFVFHKDDPFCGVDLDDCLEDGKIKPWAEELIRRFGETYGEVSPSGTGLKFWCRAKIEAGKKFTYADGAVEIYSCGRYFTVTGNRWPTATMEIVDCQETVNWLLTLANNGKKGPFKLPDKITKGSQHNTLIGYAAQLWAKNLDPEEVVQLTVAASKRCQEVPPESHAVAIAEWTISHRRRGYSEEFKSKLNGNTPKDYAFTGSEPEAESQEKDEPDETPLHYTPWPEPISDLAFHGPLGRMCRLIEPHTESDVSAVLLQCLAMIGNVFGRTVHFSAEGTNHYCNEFVCIVGATAKGRKGSGYSQVKRILTDIDRDWSHHRIRSGLTSGEGLIFHVRDQIREKKMVKGNMVEVVTDEGETDKRLLVVEEEMSSAIKAMCREGNTLSGVLRQAWDSPIVLAPMTKNNRISASNPHISVIGHITKDELVKSLKSVENTNGYTNRILWGCSKRARVLPFGGSLPTEDALSIRNELDFAIGWAQSNTVNIGFNSEAAEMWSIVYEQLGDIPSGTIGAILSRAEPHVRRIATIYAALDRSPLILPEHLEAALEVWRYCADSVRWIFDGENKNKEAQNGLRDRIFKFILDTPGGCKRRDIQQHIGGGGIKKHEMDFHLTGLLNDGRIRSVSEKRTRQSCEYYYATGKI